jgi:hypothetical protein
MSYPYLMRHFALCLLADTLCLMPMDSVTQAWTEKQRTDFLFGTSYYEGKARQMYCTTVGLDRTFIENAPLHDLVNAVSNIRLSSHFPSAPPPPQSVTRPPPPYLPRLRTKLGSYCGCSCGLGLATLWLASVLCTAPPPTPLQSVTPPHLPRLHARLGSYSGCSCGSGGGWSTLLLGSVPRKAGVGCGWGGSVTLWGGLFLWYGFGHAAAR